VAKGSVIVTRRGERNAGYTADALGIAGDPLSWDGGTDAAG
jgi:hypothetical protein